MDDLSKIINEWPVIVQGALGSALFWLVLLFGQKFARKVSDTFSLHSKKSRKSWLVSARAKYESAICESLAEQADGIVVLIYRCFRPFLKSVMWLTLGLIGNAMFYPMGIIGYVGCLYFLFQAYEIVSPIDGDKAEEELEKINQELKKLEMEV